MTTTATLFWTQKTLNGYETCEAEYPGVEEAVNAAEAKMRGWAGDIAPNETYIDWWEDEDTHKQLRWMGHKGWLNWTLDDVIKQAAEAKALADRLIASGQELAADCDDYEDRINDLAEKMGGCCCSKCLPED